MLVWELLVATNCHEPAPPPPEINVEEGWAGARPNKTQNQLGLGVVGCRRAPHAILNREGRGGRGCMEAIVVPNEGRGVVRVVQSFFHQPLRSTPVATRLPTRFVSHWTVTAQLLHSYCTVTAQLLHSYCMRNLA